MSKIKIYYDSKGKTLNVWFGNPKKEAETEEVGDGTVVSKDKSGKVIGFEKLYFDLPKNADLKSLPIEFSVA